VFWFILAIIFALVAVAAFVVSARFRRHNAAAEEAYKSKLKQYEERSDSYRYTPPRVPVPAPVGALRIVAGAAAVLALVLTFFSAAYTQDEGEAKALRSFTGELVGSDITPGISFKAPWVSAINFDTRNNIASYIGDGQSDFNGGKPTGNQITFTDKDSAAGNVDVVVTYSIRPDKIEDIYREYKTQENFRSRLIEQDIRATVRTVPSAYSTVEVLTQRSKISDGIQQALAARWERWGVTSVQVALQEIRYPDQITERFNNLTAERTRAEEAKAKTVTAENEAKTALVQAQGEAKANEARSKALTPEVLQQQYIDALKIAAEKGQLIITDGESTPLLNVPTKTAK
jgi:regulator of protease activity HflC (stomatin/prohibitin superfamily)